MTDILVISNQFVRENGIGNPVVSNIVDSLNRIQNKYTVFFYKISGFKSYNYKLLNKINQAKVVHIHFGGVYTIPVLFLSILLRKRLFVTFHGTDLHAKALFSERKTFKRIKIKINKMVSLFSILTANKVGLVSKNLFDYLPTFYLNSDWIKRKFFINDLGVDYLKFAPRDKYLCKRDLMLDPAYDYVLFSDISSTCIKRRDLAEEIVKGLGSNYRLLVMSGVKPHHVPIYINASSLLLITSDEEGSPNIVRESLALNIPVFSFDVGDVSSQIRHSENSSIIPRDVNQAIQVISSKMKTFFFEDTRFVYDDIINIDKINIKTINLYECQL